MWMLIDNIDYNWNCYLSDEMVEADCWGNGICEGKILILPNMRRMLYMSKLIADVHNPSYHTTLIPIK